MTEILQSPSHLPSSPSSSILHNDGLHQQAHLNHHPLFNSPTSYSLPVYRGGDTEEEEEGGGTRERRKRRREKEEGGDQLSLLAVVVTVFRKSLIACRSENFGGFSSSSSSSSSSSMEIGQPTNVRHVAHVTFDRFNGFLGLPVEFEPEVPRRPPSASTSVFGVSTESMQLSFDSRGNSVPTILLMMQRRLYEQGGLQAEGIFRINADNSQEEYVREQLNSGVVPNDIDVHCLAGLIKAWFRELPNGILDSLPPENNASPVRIRVCFRLRRLPPTEAALLDWAINLMADVAHLDNFNTMNARNIAMVFAPNMTQMADPLTALMYAVQVMNFLKTLTVKTMRERADSVVEQPHTSQTDPSDENGHHSYPQSLFNEVDDDNEEVQVFFTKEPSSESSAHRVDGDSTTESETYGGKGHSVDNCPQEFTNDTLTNVLQEGGSSSPNGGAQLNTRKKKTGQSSNSNIKRGPKKVNERVMVHVAMPMEKSRGTAIASRLNSRTDRVEAWR
ncbi:Rho GTPase-activating protein 1 [Camellia lanceoleosa]|uniref:Rho GTPase-activating protein 1 n=1 Tax=Camellia lanceoleosa TaxID=1840588 RepID=A0ACC0HNM1_9ERIC|nr:Rho GTPase-activating protein 1 [Camellia lanceoleosa]